MSLRFQLGGKLSVLVFYDGMAQGNVEADSLERLVKFDLGCLPSRTTSEGLSIGLTSCGFGDFLDVLDGFEWRVCHVSRETNEN